MHKNPLYNNRPPDITVALAADCKVGVTDSVNNNYFGAASNQGLANTTLSEPNNEIEAKGALDLK